MTDLLGRLVPNQAGALWFGVIVAFVVFGDHRQLLGRRNGALLFLFSIAAFLYDLLDVGASTQAWSLRFIFVTTGLMALWGVRLSRGAWADWSPNLGEQALRVLACCAIVIGTATVLTQQPDDSGIYTNLGAQRWRETGQLPYGDETLKGPDAPAFGAAATYGPVLYVINMPFQLLLGSPNNPPTADPRERDSYVRPPMMATQLASWSVFLLGLATFFLIARRLVGSHKAWGMLAVFAALPYFVGFGGEIWVIGGLRYISHIAPMAVTLLAFLLLDRPVWAGALLAIGAGVLFYPAFFFPIWLAWYYFRREGAPRFALGFLAAGAVVGLVVVAFTQTGPDESAVRLFVESTLEHQEGTDSLEYGGSSLSFWTVQPGLASILHSPLFGDTSLFKPTFMAFASFCLLLAFLSKGRSRAQLAALTAAAGSAVQLWKTHATGSYVEWYIPFLLIALLAQSTSEATDAPLSDGGPGSAEAASAA